MSQACQCHDEPGVPVHTWTPRTLETKAGGVELEQPGETSP